MKSMTPDAASLAATQIGEAIAEEHGTDLVRPWLDSFSYWLFAADVLGHEQALGICRRAASVKLSEIQTERGYF